MNETFDQLKYPIGKFIAPTKFEEGEIENWIGTIGALPLWLDHIIENLDAAQLDTPYRLGGWTMAQTIHHLADSHMNAFIRIKLALTEHLPAVKPYNEALWAETPEIFEVPVNVSITLLHALHRRWISLLKNLTHDDWNRSYFHPEHQKEVPIWEVIALYAWHSKHHMEQLRGLKERMAW